MKYTWILILASIFGKSALWGSCWRIPHRNISHRRTVSKHASSFPENYKYSSFFPILCPRIPSVSPPARRNTQFSLTFQCFPAEISPRPRRAGPLLPVYDPSRYVSDPLSLSRWWTRWSYRTRWTWRRRCSWDRRGSLGLGLQSRRSKLAHPTAFRFSWVLQLNGAALFWVKKVLFSNPPFFFSNCLFWNYYFYFLSLALLDFALFSQKI